MSGQRGFTLIEVMVAILLMAIVALIGWRGLDSVARSNEHLRASGEREEALLRALNQLQRDLELRAGIELRPPARLDAPDTQARPGPSAVVVRGGGNLPTRLELVRLAPSRPGHLQRVRWWVENGVLYRAAAPAASRLPLPQPGQGVALLDGVQDFSLRAWGADQRWHAPAGRPARDPRGLEVSFGRRTPLGLERYRQVFGPLE